MKVCAESGCASLTDSTRCERHRKAKRRQEDRRRPNAKQRGYDAKWRRTRATYLQLYPICQCSEGCIATATEVHHIDGKGPNGPRGHDFQNLMGLCKRHHDKLTAELQPGGFRAS